MQYASLKYNSEIQADKDHKIMKSDGHCNKRSAWKNERSSNNKAYVPTYKEHLANILTHGVGNLLVYDKEKEPSVQGAGSSCTVAFIVDVLGSHYSHPTVVLKVAYGNF